MPILDPDRARGLEARRGQAHQLVEEDAAVRVASAFWHEGYASPVLLRYYHTTRENPIDSRVAALERLRKFRCEQSNIANRREPAIVEPETAYPPVASRAQEEALGPAVWKAPVLEPHFALELDRAKADPDARHVSGHFALGPEPRNARETGRLSSNNLCAMMLTVRRRRREGEHRDETDTHHFGGLACDQFATVVSRSACGAFHGAQSSRLAKGSSARTGAGQGMSQKGGERTAP
jgi:hypothetical protein